MRAGAVPRPAAPVSKPAAPAAVKPMAEGARPGADSLAEISDRSMPAFLQPLPAEPDPGLKGTEDAARRGDAGAQYRLGRMYLDGRGVARNPVLAVNWLNQAAVKGQYEAQATLGILLLGGNVVPGDVPNGLMWLKIAMDAAPPGASGYAEICNAAWRQATEDERLEAIALLEKWRAGGRRRPAESGDRLSR
jgi:TPR repeat protein